MKRARVEPSGAALLLAAALAVVGPAHAMDINCDKPAVPERDAEGNPYCAEPNLNCYEDYPPTYAGNGIWLCPSIEEVQAEQRLKAGPKISCPMGAVMWNAKAGDWSCEQLTECQSCERCFDYVELAKRQCVEKSRRVAWAKCNGTYGSTWRGERVSANGRVCEKRMIQDETSGRTHTIETNCTGPAIDECVNGWEVSHPGESSGSSRSGSVSYKVGAKAGGKILGIGVEVSGERATQDTEGQSYSVTWGGGKGFLAACDEGADKVAALCSDCSGVCGEQ